MPVKVDSAGGHRSAPAAAPGLLEERYRDLIEDALIGIYVSTPDGRLVACNAAFARLLGFASVTDAVGSNMAALYTDAGSREARVGQVRETGRLEQYRERLLRRDGTHVDVIETVVGAFDPHGGLTELRGFIVDVTASAAAAPVAGERARQFLAAFSDVADAMLILDDDAIICESNDAASALFDVSCGALVSGRLDSLIVGDVEPFAHVWRELMALGEAKREHRITKGTARGVRIVECSYRAHVRVGRHLCIARDITERRALEERIVQSEKIESVGRLAGGIAHDFNNLLTAILGYTELLLADRGADDPDRADLEEIQKAGQRAASLTQQLLAFSRRQVLVPKDVDLNQTVASLRSMLARLIREDITLTCVPAPLPAVVRIDPTQIEQVILNLVLNSRDALPGGGRIRIEVASVRSAEVEIPPDLAIVCDTYVRLRVVDNGVGIAPEAHAHLFEPFFTTKELGKGTGLGLASVYGIVRQSNGFITVESEQQAGTTFTMHFPAVAPLKEPAVSQAMADASVRGRATVLLVEDEPAVRAIITAVLQRHGYDVLEAATPSAAIELFDQHHAAIDLLLTDVVMPDMNGPALAQRLVALRPELRILFISGYADVLLPIDGARNVSFLGKPFQASVLAAKVREALNQERA